MSSATTALATTAPSTPELTRTDPKADPMTTTIDPHQSTPSQIGAAATAPTASPTPRVTFPRLVSSEWLKFRTLRSNAVALGGGAAAAVGFGALFSYLADSGDGPSRLANNALALSLGGFDIAQIVIAILGVALVAGEYQSGLIRSWFAAAPDRMRVLAAKVGVYGAVTFVVTFVAATLAFLAGQALLPDSFAALSFTSDGVLQALAGTAFYGACIGIMGIGLGFLTRSTAAGTGISVGTLMIGPLLVRLLPASIGDPISKILPSNAGAALSGLDTTTELLSTGWGFAVLCAWVVGVVGAAALTLRRRDA